MRESNWYSFEVCIKCYKILSNRQILYSNGTCPYCGHTNDSTITDSIKITLKKFKHHKWWQFWKRKVVYVGNNLLSQKWLKNELNEQTCNSCGYPFYHSKGKCTNALCKKHGLIQ